MLHQQRNSLHMAPSPFSDLVPQAPVASNEYNRFTSTPSVGLLGSTSSTSVQISEALAGTRSPSPSAGMFTTSRDASSDNGRLEASRFETPPHTGPGTSVYVRQPTKDQIVRPLSSFFRDDPSSLVLDHGLSLIISQKSNLFADPKRPFYFRDPEGQPFIDIDGKICGERWIMVDLRAGEEDKGRQCVIC